MHAFYAAGARVGVAWLRETCGQCAYCRRGRENLCLNARFTGYDHDGGYAEFAVVREDFAYAIPDGLGDEAAAPLLMRGDNRLSRDQARRGPARCDRRPLRLRRLGAYRDPGAEALAMPRVRDEPRRTPSGTRRGAGRRLGRSGRRAAAAQARRRDSVRAGRRVWCCRRWRRSTAAASSRLPEFT